MPHVTGTFRWRCEAGAAVAATTKCLSQANFAFGVVDVAREPAPERRELHENLVILGAVKANKAQRVIRDCQGRLADSIGTGIGIGLQTLAASRATSLRRWGCAGSTSFRRHGYRTAGGDVQVTRHSRSVGATKAAIEPVRSRTNRRDRARDELPDGHSATNVPVRQRACDMTTITVNSLRGCPLTLDPASAKTMKDAKVVIETQRNVNTYRQRLLFGDAVLEDDAVLAGFGPHAHLTLAVLTYAVDTVEELVDAVESADTGEITRLLSVPTDPNARSGLPMQCAVGTAHAEITQLLLDALADPNAKYSGWVAHSALHLACQIATSNVAKVLLQAGANPDIRDEDGDPPMVVAAQNGNRDVLNELIASRADESGVASALAVHARPVRRLLHECDTTGVVRGGESDEAGEGNQLGHLGSNNKGRGSWPIHPKMLFR